MGSIFIGSALTSPAPGAGKAVLFNFSFFFPFFFLFPFSGNPLSGIIQRINGLSFTF
jgi:hypothetical protein